MRTRTVDILPHTKRVVELEYRRTVGLLHIHLEALPTVACHHGIAHQLLIGHDKLVGAHVDAGIGVAAAYGIHIILGRAAIRILSRYGGSIIAIIPQQLAATGGGNLGTHQDREEITLVELLGINTHIHHGIEHLEGGRRLACRYRHAANQLLANVRFKQLAQLAQRDESGHRP